MKRFKKLNDKQIERKNKLDYLFSEESNREYIEKMIYKNNKK